MYEMADQGWRRQPRIMSPAVTDAALAAIAAHADAHGLDVVRIVLHGGEPLLAGAAFLEDIAQRARAAMPTGTRAELAVQTNGTLLGRPILEMLRRNEIRVGVSLDGGPAATDRHRRDPRGRGSYTAVAAALDLLREERYRDIYGGLLCVVSLENDPEETYDALAAFGPPLVDFLLPHGTWTVPPPGRPPDGSTPYADWLLRVFYHWAASPANRPGIRIFDQIIAVLLGGTARTGGLGLAPLATVMINTDGTVGLVDALHAAYDGAADTGLNVLTSSLDPALEQPATAAMQIGHLALSGQCAACGVRDTCGGGYYPHRYRAGDGFRNPSVYCPDLLALITRLRRYVAGEVARLLPGGSA
jgi:uncharacterized protein